MRWTWWPSSWWWFFTSLSSCSPPKEESWPSPESLIQGLVAWGLLSSEETQLLQQRAFEKYDLSSPSSTFINYNDHDYDTNRFSFSESFGPILLSSDGSSINLHGRTERWLQQESMPAAAGDGEEEEGGPPWWINLMAALICVSVAALAAGLTLGLLGLDPLLLLIKQRAADSELERQRAAQLLPLVQQHHRLLVTLLLMNAMANEALPIFLEKLVPPTVAILLSVTLVLFFGEIIPSAIFTGPNQILMASRLAPVVRIAMMLLYPIAGPIAALLDCWLHENDDKDEHADDAYNRGELAALIRIQYEERLAAKGRRKQQRRLVAMSSSSASPCEDHHQHKGASSSLAVDHDHPPSSLKLILEGDHLGALDFTDPRRRTLQAVKHQLEHQADYWAAVAEGPGVNTGDVHGSMPGDPAVAGHSAARGGGGGGLPDPSGTLGSSLTQPSGDRDAATVKTQFYERSQLKRSNSIHADEVAMVEGALQMKTRVALDVFTPMRDVFAIPDDLILTEENLVYIYSKGFTRVPVYQAGHSTHAIRGLLLVKQLIVVAPKDHRAVHTLPLRTPLCVHPQISLVDLLNLFQTGGRAMRGGHMALVCGRPKIGNQALARGQPVPAEAGLAGIITMEDVLEALLQEEIYDEMDQSEKRADRLASSAYRHWRRFIQRKKEGSLGVMEISPPALVPIVQRAVAAASSMTTNSTPLNGTMPVETTALLDAQPLPPA